MVLWGAPLSAETERIYYGFLRTVGNSWTYRVEQVGPRPEQNSSWIEEHEVLAVENWGRIRIAKIAVNVKQNGVVIPPRRYFKTYMTYLGSLYETRGRDKFSRGDASRWLHRRPPLMQWSVGIKTWSHRRDKRETYRSGGLREFRVPAGTFNYIKTFQQQQLAGRIQRIYWVDFKSGILKIELKARTPEGLMQVTHTLTRFSVRKPSLKKRKKPRY
ncbi:MAG: hypothetical protein KC609_03635 [Myxococcales bacterium]|nr:hypothetical protein [Myxococcales bacterium]